MNTRAPSRRCPMKASLVLAFFACTVPLWSVAAEAVETTEGEGAARFVPVQLPGREGQPQALWALQRGPLAQPLRYRVVVVPGSGCAGMGPLADRYFRGLLHAQVTVLHKPGVHPHDTTAPADCPPSFVQTDSLARWAAYARAALEQIEQTARTEQSEQTTAMRTPAFADPRPPLLLVGISEGVELLPALAAAAGPSLAGMVMMAGSGLDPREAGQLQAQRTGHGADWDALGRAQASAAPDTAVRQGRSLRYWRDLWQWPVQQPLIDGPWPLLQVWGARDELVPEAAYQQFAQAAQRRAAPYCARSLPGADHGLQAPGFDGVQQVWQWVQQWGRAPGAGLCAPLFAH